MPRSYRHIQRYEKELLKMKEEGMTVRAIGDKFGLTYEQIHDFFKRYNRKQRKIEAGTALKRRGSPAKDYIVSELDKAAELRYILDCKEAKIKSLETENELMRDFFSLTERK